MRYIGGAALSMCAFVVSPVFGAEATDPAAFVEKGALGALFFVLWWLTRRSDRNHNEERAERLKLEAQLANANAEISEQRHQKHDAINRQAAAEGTLKLVKAAARRCTCEAMTPLVPLLET